MLSPLNDQTTIAALATPPGRGGVGIIRISGPLTQSITKAILNKEIQPRIATFSPFYDENNQTIDQGIALFFPGPHSFTGEDILELQAHGGPVILDCLLKRILQLGAQLAQPGEFTQRAFLNDKIDLTQAEAIIDLINASSEQAARSAFRSLQGEFSICIHELVESLIQLRVYIEAAIDFSEEEIDFLKIKEIEKNLDDILTKLLNVKQSAKQGSLLRDGMTVVIAGKPNAGKSSLLNWFSGKETAIVTDVAGTTRDVLREYINLDGMPLHIVDTAGLQETENVIEQEGIRRAWKEIEQADKILLMTDHSKIKEDDPQKIWPEFFEKIANKKLITIIKNKIDLTEDKPHIENRDHYSIVYLSVKREKGMDLLKEHLKKCMGYENISEGTFIARRRHLDALSKAEHYLKAAQVQLTENKMIELLAEDLLQAQNTLSEITGEFTPDDLIGEIFSTFCIGK